MEGFLTFILFAVIGFYILGFVVRFLLKRYLRKVQKQFEGFSGGAGNPFSGHSQADERKHEGDVTVQGNGNDKKFKKDVGEYVDFEEVK